MYPRSSIATESVFAKAFYSVPLAVAPCASRASPRTDTTQDRPGNAPDTSSPQKLATPFSVHPRFLLGHGSTTTPLTTTPLVVERTTHRQARKSRSWEFKQAALPSFPQAKNLRPAKTWTLERTHLKVRGARPEVGTARRDQRADYTGKLTITAQTVKASTMLI